MVERNPIDKLARAVADRSPVSWEDELRSTPDNAGRGVVEQLRLVDRIVDAHWGVPDSLKHLGDFEILREIGRGSMGVVYEARQVSLDRNVALKVLAPGLTGDAVRLKRFEREARTLATLSHPNIVTVHSVEEIDGVHFISMELVDGQPLSTYIPNGGMAIEPFLEVAIPLADAVSSAHEHRVVHRDLKPANILINNDSRVKVLDFGLAKLRGEAGSGVDSQATTLDPEETRPGIVVGTVPYMSPEQAEGRPVDHRSDLFSIGTNLYEMATGRRPFRGDSPGAVMTAIARDTPQRVTEIKPELPPDLDRIIGHCLRKDREHRYQTAKGLRNELEELKESIGPERPKPRPVLNLPRWAWFSAAVALVIALVVGPYVVEKIREWLEPPRYLAVLPFTHLGDGDAEIDAFTDGLTEILTAKLTRLTRTHELQIAPASQVRLAPPLTLDTIHEKLGVTLALVGILHQSGNDVRATINLVDVHRQRQLRAEVLNLALSDPFAFQDQIVVAAVDMLDLELPTLEEEALRAHGTIVAAAHEIYLQGRGYLSNYHEPGNVDNAIAAFEQALERDPDYAQAHACLGMAFWRRFEHDRDPRWVDRASESCRRAVELNDDLAVGHACLGTVFLGTGRYGAAATEFGWAMSQDPTLDEAYRGLARVFERLGEPDSAEEVYLKAVRERPHYWATHNWLGAFYFRRGDLEKAERSFERVIALAPLAPDSYRGYQNLGGVYLQHGRYDDAISVLERSVELKPTAHGYSNLAAAYFSLRRYGEAVRYYEEAVEHGRGDFYVWGNLGEAYYWMPGGRAKALRAYRRAVGLAEQELEVNPDDAEILGELGKYHAMLDNREEALQCLSRALEVGPSSAELEFNAAVIYTRLGEDGTAVDWLERSRASGMPASWIRDNPVFDGLRGDARYRELIE